MDIKTLSKAAAAVLKGLLKKRDNLENGRIGEIRPLSNFQHYFLKLGFGKAFFKYTQLSELSPQGSFGQRFSKSFKKTPLVLCHFSFHH